jgi:predicted SnoaL-like aldol condensation-catalyzing enzyme
MTTRGRRTMSVIAMTSMIVAGVLAFSGSAKTTLEQNKETVTAFYKLAFNDHNPVQAIEKYVGKTYTQHNPMAGDGPQAFIDFASGFARSHPGLRVDIKRVIAEGDLVVTHVHIKTSDEDRGLAAIDIFRLEDGKIVEHWDVVQPVPEKPANENTMF